MNKLFVFLITLSSYNVLAQTSDIQIVAENLEPFTLVINGQKVSNTPSETHNVSGLFQNTNYDILIDYLMPDSPDIRTTLYIGNDVASGVLIYTVPKFYQGSLIYSGVSSANSSISMNNNISMNMNVSEQGFNISMNVDDNSSQNNSPTQTNLNHNQGNTIVYVPGYNGSVGCSQPVSSERFEDMMSSVEDASFAEDKVRVCKRIMKTNCLIIDNLIEMLEEITFDEDQLVLAKFAYDHIYDLENYYKVYDVFSFSSSGEELEEYIENR